VGCRETIAHSTRSAVAQRGGEEIIQGLNGFLVAPQNAKVLAKAMHEAARDPAKLAEMSRASRSLAESRFPVSEVIRLILQGMNIPRSADAATPANPPAQAALAPV
jgi:glycosyltransferase involved in cell wall biosynthesis